MSAGRIYTGRDIAADTRVSCDVVVVGSGSGGAWLAHELASQGRRVVMLEEGGYHTRAEFDMTEARAFPNLYQDLGNRTTDDLSISVLQGRSVGGGTTVNWCASFRTPPRILEHWARVHGVRGLTTEALTPHWEHVEKRLHIKEWPEAAINKNNRVLWEGLGKLGYERGLIKRNVHNCANLGYCGVGCPLDAKQSMLATVIPDAVEKGLDVYANASVRTIEWSGRRASAVVASINDPETEKATGKTLRVEARVVAVCGGAINSPALLLRSGFSAPALGRYTWLHPVVVTLAEFEDEIQPYSGAPQSVYSHQFSDRGPGRLGFFLEVPPVHPMLASIVATGTGAQVQDVLGRIRHINAMLAIHTDGLLAEETGGTVSLKKGAYTRVGLNYDFLPQHWEAFRFACREMAKIQFAAGARRVLTLHDVPVEMKSEAELGKLDDAPWERLRLRVVTAHQMGGCRMGSDAASSVVDNTFRLHSMDNVFVVDGSVLPTSLGVNPQQTIFALARYAAPGVSEAVR